MSPSPMRRIVNHNLGDVDAIYFNTADPELKLPKISALAIVLISNFIMQVSSFIVVPASNEYAIHLGGTSVFSGVAIGIPPAFSALSLIFMTKYDKGTYKFSIHTSCAAAILGHILYALAYYTDFLYLILIGRAVTGVTFASLMYNKKYCTDGRIVGVRRRTMLTSWIVITQGLGMSAGPFFGGLLYKVGFSNRVFNGFTSPGWIMAGVWAIFWVCAAKWFEDPPNEPQESDLPKHRDDVRSPTRIHLSANLVPTTATDAEKACALPTPPASSARVMSPGQWGVSICMCWFSLTCFFILASWEVNLPVFGASHPALHWSPFAAGNFIALGAISAFPFLLANVFIARRMQDRYLVLIASGLGMAGLVVFVSLLQTQKVSYGSLFVCWWIVALGFNLASGVTVSLLSKQLPQGLNGMSSLAIQYSINAGRVGGAIWGGSGVKVGMAIYAGLEIGMVGIGVALFVVLWKEMKAKTG